MEFLNGLKLVVAIAKAKLKCKNSVRMATIEFALELSGPKCDEILGELPGAIVRGFNAMGKQHGKRFDFDMVIHSQNLECRMAPDMHPSLRITDTDIHDLRLEMYDKSSGAIALYFSVTTELTKEVAVFLAANFGESAWLTVSECQQQLPMASAVERSAARPN